MAQPAAANNVLSKLDGQKPSAFYWQQEDGPLGGSGAAPTPVTT